MFKVLVLSVVVFMLVESVITKAAEAGGRRMPENPNSGTAFEAANLREIVLAGGCFWGVEAFMDRVPGVAFTEVGYANGNTENPTYQEVCEGDTGHAEAVLVRYDSSRITLKKLLSAYFSIINPTSKNRQGGDFGTQYRTGVYLSAPNMEEDRAIAKEIFEMVGKQYDKPLAVELEPLKSFYRAEEYHQKYLDKNPGGYCHVNFDRLKDIPDGR